MVNHRRGEVPIILDGKRFPLVLTLGALAELEESLQLNNIAQLAERFAAGHVRMQDLVKILGAALRAGGADISDEKAAAMRCEGGAPALASALVKVMQITFAPLKGNDDAETDLQAAEGQDTQNPTQAGL